MNLCIEFIMDVYVNITQALDMVSAIHDLQFSVNNAANSLNFLPPNEVFSLPDEIYTKFDDAVACFQRLEERLGSNDSSLIRIHSHILGLANRISDLQSCEGETREQCLPLSKPHQAGMSVSQSHSPGPGIECDQQQQWPISGHGSSTAFSRPSLEIFARPDDYVPHDSYENDLHYSFKIEEMRNLLSRSSSAMCFDGDPEFFEAWRSDMVSSLRRIGCGADQCLRILLNNTSGEPHEVIRKLMRSGMAPTRTLKQVWCSLRGKFGSEVMISQSLFSHVISFPKICDSCQGDIHHQHNVKLLEDFYYVCEQVARNMDKYPDLKFFDSRLGLDMILDKMSPNFLSEWEKHASYLKRVHHILHPNLLDLLKLMDEYIDRKSFPYVSPVSSYHGTPPPSGANFSTNSKALVSCELRSRPITVSQPTISVVKSSCVDRPSGDTSLFCPLHREMGHDLAMCPTYLNLPVKERRAFVAHNHLCYVCLLPHFVRDCPGPHPCIVPDCNLMHHTSLHH